MRRSERIKASLLLGLSCAMALLIGVIVWQSVAAMRAEIAIWRDHDDRVAVIVAAGELGQGHPIGVEDLALREVPADYVPRSVLRDSAQAIHRVPMERILAGEMIREERLAPIERGGSMAAIIPQGMRAVTVDLANGAAVSGFLDPGNWVDVLLTVRRDGEAPAETVTLLQTVRVLTVDERRGAGSKPDPKERTRPSVTLLVSPEQAEQLTHAVAQGDVVLVLRNDVDATEIEQHGATVEDLLGRPEQRLEVRRFREARAEQGGDGTTFIRGDRISQE